MIQATAAAAEDAVNTAAVALNTGWMTMQASWNAVTDPNLQRLQDMPTLLRDDLTATYRTSWQGLQALWGAAEGKPGLPGILHDEIVANPTDYRGYVNLGAQIAATGIPGGSRLGLPDPTSALWNAAFGEGASGYVMAVSYGSKSLSALMSINAVSNALGSAAPALKGVFNVTSATSDLLGNVVSGVVKASSQAYASAAINLGKSFVNLGTGNFSGLQNSAGDTAVQLFTITSGGFSPSDLGAVASSAGQALLDLASGNPRDAGASAVALGVNVLKSLKNNMYFVAAKEAIVQYVDTIVDDLMSAYDTAATFIDNLVHGGPPSRPQDLIADLAGVAEQAYNKKSSLPSSYGDFYHGKAVDGYLAAATVFVDSNGNGALDPGEYSTTTDAQGGYALPSGLVGSIVMTGGTDTATGLANTATFHAPSGSSIVSPLTTLVKKVAEARGDVSAAGVQSATASVVAALGLSAGTNLLTLDPEAGARSGDPAATAIFKAGVNLVNISSLAAAAGGAAASGNIVSALVTSIANGAAVDLTTTTGIAALASSAGLPPTAAGAVGTMAGAANAALATRLASGGTPGTLYSSIVEAARAVQGTGAQMLATAATAGTGDAFSSVATSFTQSGPISGWTTTPSTSPTDDGSLLSSPFPTPPTTGTEGATMVVERGTSILVGSLGTDVALIADGGSTLMVSYIDTLVGGAGTDVITLGNAGGTLLLRGVETLMGSAGIDVVAWDNRSNIDEPTAVRGVETLIGSAGYDHVILLPGTSPVSLAGSWEAVTAAGDQAIDLQPGATLTYFASGDEAATLRLDRTRPEGNDVLVFSAAPVGTGAALTVTGWDAGRIVTRRDATGNAAQVGISGDRIVFAGDLATLIDHDGNGLVSRATETWSGGITADEELVRLLQPVPLDDGAALVATLGRVQAGAACAVVATNGVDTGLYAVWDRDRNGVVAADEVRHLVTLAGTGDLPLTFPVFDRGMLPASLSRASGLLGTAVAFV